MSCMTWDKWAKSAMVFPETVQVESTNRCNSRCNMCPVPDSKRKKEDMTREVFMKVVNDCKPFASKLTQFQFHQNGEPMLIGAKELAWRIDYAKEHLPTVPMGFFTNGSLMDEEATEIILDSKLDFIAFSFDGGTKESYEYIRKGLNFESVHRNICHFALRKHERGQATPRISTVFCPQKENINTWQQYTQLFTGKHIDDIGGGGICNYAGGIDSDEIRVSGQYFHGDRYSPCWRLWTFLIIGSNGKAMLCCNDYEIAAELGDIKTQTMKEIWNGEAIKKYREYMLNGWQDQLKLCDKCDWMQTFNIPDWWYKNGDERIF